MALIIVYDATELDKQQLTAGLQGSDHHWEYINQKIQLENCHPEAEVISVFTTSTVTRAMIEKMPKLRLIACRSTGFNNIDLAAAQEYNVCVVNVPVYGSATVAEYTFALLLALTRRIPNVLKAEHESFATETLTGTDLNQKTFGVVGTGNIGQRAIAIAKGFGMRVIAYDTKPKEDIADALDFTYFDLEKVLAESDILSLHTPYTPETRHLLNSERLQSMRKGAIIINTARGELIDTKALIASLESGHLGGAAIDVIEGESLLKYDEETALLRQQDISDGTARQSVAISILKKMPNVIISPHNSYNTREAIQRINETTTKNIIDFWYGITPNKIVSQPTKLGRLIIARHAESEWNATGRWTGTTDIHLSGKGFKEAAKYGLALKELNLTINHSFCSEQIRTRETLEIMLAVSGNHNLEVKTNAALNERDYGDYTGKNKWEIKSLLGEAKFDELRRGWDVPVPNGETLKMVYGRVVPFFISDILPKLKSGHNVLLVAHGNSIRALMKYIETIDDQDVSELEMLFGQIVIYDLDDSGHAVKINKIQVETEVPLA